MRTALIDRRKYGKQSRTIDRRLRLRDEYQTIIVGLRVASQLGSEHLRAEYARLANVLANDVRRELFVDGDGI